MLVELTPPDHWGGPLATLVVYGIGGLVLVGHFLFAVYGWLSHRLAASRARAAESRQPPPLKPGSISLYGAVETDDEGPALTFTLLEIGKERESKSSWSYEWRESARKLTVQPFTLRLASGDAVRVFPDEKAIYIDTLEARLLSNTTRERKATLIHGEQARVDGVLSGIPAERSGGAYRAGEARLPEVRAGLTEALRVVVGGLVDGHEHWATWYGSAARLLGILLVILHLLVCRDYHLLNFTGHVVDADVVGRHSSVATSKKALSDYFVDVQYQDERGQLQKATGKVSLDAYNAVAGGELKWLTFLVAPAFPSVHVAGTRPMLSNLRILIVGGSCLLGLAIFWLERARKRPWYEQSRVVEEGDGKLSDSMPSTTSTAP